jgi:penicillin-binding protein 1B
MLVIEPRTGQLLALVGGRDHSLFPFNRAISARRQPASVFKPVVALAALAKGGEEAPAFTLASVLSDTPMHVRTSGGDWYPTNHDRRYRGDVTLRQALEQSLNVPMARLGVAVGPTHIIAAARRLGIESPLAPLPSLPLGTFEVRLIEMTRAYGVLAAGGRRAPLRPTLGLVRPDGARFELPTPPTLRVYRASEVYLVTSALQGVIDRGTGTAVRELGYQGAIAGKTGSSDDFRDAWFVGYTPDVVVGVWVGFDDNHPVGLAGSAAALPIAMDFLVGLLGQRGGSAIRPPPGIERTRVRIREGGRCRRLVEVFLSGTAPAPVCDGGGGEP